MAIVAVVWMIFMSIVFLFPTSPGPSALDMNYTVVVFAGVMLLSVLYFYFPKYGGVHWFAGPVRNVDIGDGYSEKSHGSMEKEAET